MQVGRLPVNHHAQLVTTCWQSPSKIYFLFYSPSSIDKTKNNVFTFSSFRRLALPVQMVASRLSPLPRFNWADPEEVWNSLCRKDKLYSRNQDYIMSHASLQPRMRAILLDWLIEVSFCLFLLCHFVF